MCMHACVLVDHGNLLLCTRTHTHTHTRRKRREHTTRYRCHSCTAPHFIHTTPWSYLTTTSVYPPLKFKMWFLFWLTYIHIRTYIYIHTYLQHKELCMGTLERLCPAPTVAMISDARSHCLKFGGPPPPQPQVRRLYIMCVCVCMRMNSFVSM
jgi:hypothetical protein